MLTALEDVRWYNPIHTPDDRAEMLRMNGMLMNSYWSQEVAVKGTFLTL